MPEQTKDIPCKEFLTHVRQFTELLGWVPYLDAMQGKENIIVYGTSRKSLQHECFVSIDWKFKLFKIELFRLDDTTKVSSKCVVKYETDKEAIAKFDHFMDATGAFYKEACLNG